MKIIDVSKYWPHICKVSRLALIKFIIQQLNERLKGDKKALELLKELESLCFDKKI